MSKFFLISNRYFYLLLIVLLSFSVLYPKFPLVNIAGTYVAVRLEDLLILSVLIFWGVVNLTHFNKYIKLTIFQIFGLFWLSGLLSLISGILITHSVIPHLGLFHLLRRIEYMGLFFVAATSITSEKKAKIIVISLFVTTLAVVVYGYGQMWLDFPVISTTNKEFSKGLILFMTKGARVSSTFAGHYDLALYLSLVLMFLAAFFYYYQKLWQKILIIILSVSEFILLGFTAARVSFITALFGLCLFFWLNKKKYLIGLIFLAALLTLAIVPDLRHRLVATITVNLLGGGGEKYNPPPNTYTIFTPLNQLPSESRDEIRKRLIEEATKPGKASKMPIDTVPGEPVNTTELGVFRSFGIRFNVEWPRAFNAFLKNPFLGTGYSSITLATDNDLLRSLGEVGILGTISLGLIFTTIFKKLLSFIKKTASFEKTFSFASLNIIIVLLINGLFIDVFEASKIAEIFWLLMGVTWALLNKYQIDENNNVV